MDADKRAHQILEVAGYNPLALETILRRMKRSSSSLSRHPSNEERIKKVNSLIKKSAYPGHESIRQRRLSAYVNKFL